MASSHVANVARMEGEAEKGWPTMEAAVGPIGRGAIGLRCVRLEQWTGVGSSFRNEERRRGSMYNPLEVN
jgi:hypothetical protein